MAIISMFSSSLSLRPHGCPSAPLHPSSSCLRRASVCYPFRSLLKKTALKRIVRAVAEEETVASEAEPTPKVEQTPSAEQAVTVPVSPSDLLTMFFKAEGTMDDTAISKLSNALEGKEGVGDLKVQNLEGIASVEDSFLWCFGDLFYSYPSAMELLGWPVHPRVDNRVD